jgi:hypothetical protein
LQAVPGMRDTSGGMEAGRFTRRQRHAGILVCALGVGLVAFTFIDGDAPGVSRDPRPARSTTSEASVLGVVITQPEATSLPPASPASPVEIDPTTTRRAPTTTARPAGTSATTAPPPATTAPDPTLIDPTVIENTTTTTEPPPPTTIDLSTTTTAPPTTEAAG